MSKKPLKHSADNPRNRVYVDHVERVVVRLEGHTYRSDTLFTRRGNAINRAKKVAEELGLAYTESAV